MLLQMKSQLIVEQTLRPVTYKKRDTPLLSRIDYYIGSEAGPRIQLLINSQKSYRIKQVRIRLL